MENTKDERVRGNPVIPPPYIPSQVRMSMVPKPPEPIAKVDVEGREVEVTEDQILEQSDANLPEIDVEMDAKPKGVIVIKVFENSPYEVEFSGVVTGSEVDIAWKAMMKEYRVWKHNLYKKETDAKTSGGG